MSDSFDDALARGAELFDAGAFFAAHEAWEERWRIESSSEPRRLLQGLIQIAAGFHKLFVSGAPSSASRLFARGLAKLEECQTLAPAHGLEPFIVAMQGYAREAARGSHDRVTIPRLRPKPTET